MMQVVRLKVCVATGDGKVKQGKGLHFGENLDDSADRGSKEIKGNKLELLQC